MNPLIPLFLGTNFTKADWLFLPFTEDFVNPTLKNEGLSQSALFITGGNHVFFPDNNSLKLLKPLYENMLSEIQSDYHHKYDLL